MLLLVLKTSLRDRSFPVWSVRDIDSFLFNGDNNDDGSFISAALFLVKCGLLY